MAKGSVVVIHSLERVDSTQRYLIERLKSGELVAPVAVTATEQYAGKGSRDNQWSGLKGNLFLSFAVSKTALAADLKLESASIYFTYLLKEALENGGSQVWVKWPNDLYLGDMKIGGAITNIVGKDLVYGVGVNTVAAPEGFGTLDIEIKQESLLNHYFEMLEKAIPWKQIFRKYALEFDKNKIYFTHHFGQRIALENAVLQDDGSIECDGQRIYSLR
jgi:BirA family biotin operon repressor/biotin-[acetyl-CoA-carboxylase] ligase